MPSESNTVSKCAPGKKREYYLRYAAKHDIKSLASLKAEAQARTEKACSKCQIVKPMSGFVRSGKSRDGRASECAACMHIRTKTWNLAKKAERAKEREARRAAEFISGHKKCSKCEIQKPLEAYAKNSRGPGGKMTACRDCMKPAIDEGNRRWRAKHPEQMKAITARYRKDHPYPRTIQEVRAAKLAKADRLEKACKKCSLVKSVTEFGLSKKTADGRSYQCLACLAVKERRRYARNPQMLEYRKAWRKQHPEGGRHIAQKRRARQKDVGGSHTLAQWRALCAKFENRCVCCGKVGKLTRDHVIPLTNRNSSHDIANIQPLCYSCNSAKGNRRCTDYRDAPFTGHRQ